MLFANDALARDVRRLAAPAIASSLLQTLVFVVDRVMLGRHGPAALGGMQIAGSLEWSLFSVVSAFEVGTLARVGQHAGAGRVAEVRRVAFLSVAVAAGLGALLAFATPLLLLGIAVGGAGSASAAVAEATRYLEVMLPASPLVFVTTAAIAVFQGKGDTRTPLLVGGAANLLHVAQNRVLVLGALGCPALGARGAGISTALTFGLEAVVLVGLLARDARRAEPGVALSQGALAELAPLIRVGVPSLGERIVYHAGYLGYAAMVAGLGADAMAANQALISVEAICFLSADGFGVAAAAMVAQQVGRGEHEQAVRSARLATGYAVVLLTTLGLVALGLRGVLLPAFCDAPSVLAIGLGTMPVLALAQPFMAVGVVRAQALRGASATGRALGVSLAGALVVRLLATWFFAFRLGLGLVGVWLGSTVDWVVRAALYGALGLPRRPALSRGSGPARAAPGPT